MNFWRPIDALGYGLFAWWTPQLQVRTGVLTLLAGTALAFWGPFSGEQFLIYEMSAWALIIGGMGVVETAILAVRQDPETDPEDLKPE